MKSTKIENNELRELKFPLLMKSSETGSYLVVLITDKKPFGGVGTVVHDSRHITKNYEIGHHSESWDLDSFEPYYGEILLSND